ncbi:insulin-like growth factor-binding protein 2-B isoform X2 [Boleophthalmus pectinirostris]|uniref:insulin-like growth factor-binding protein 2-B isoform X2 n=1 Tax=Boleophthalmus pectinirostris TaxID=150288 RepID=UPI000A1C5CBA|nr:insulin-like growth factor-binding protein 2-B isoform X2 [Boleophthalmus pectinirostris]
MLLRLFCVLLCPGPALLLGDLVFRCPPCTAELLSLCPQVPEFCGEIVREPGCGCCPVCARAEGEFCGVYTPRCLTGLRCYPAPGALFPLQDLLMGLGRCGQRVELPTVTNEMLGTESPPLPRRPPLDPRAWQEAALKQHLKETRTRMKTCPRVPVSACQMELDRVMEAVAKITTEDHRGPLENLSELKFPNCDRFGLYNIKQCNMSLRGQRGECWCVNPLTGDQIPASPRVRGDPNCEQYFNTAETATEH